MERYFPEILINEHNAAIHSHPLRGIIATYVTNSMINRVGLTFTNRVRERTGDAAPEIARAYIVARDVFDIRALWAQVEALDNEVPASAQSKMLVHIKRLVQRAPFVPGECALAHSDGCARGFLCGRRFGPDRGARRRYRGPPPGDPGRLRGGLVAVGVPQSLADRVASADLLASGCDIVRLASQIDAPVADAAAVYFRAGSRYSLDWLRLRSTRYHRDALQKLAISAVDDLFNHQITLAQEVIGDARSNGGGDGLGMRRRPSTIGPAAGAGGPHAALAEIRAQEQVIRDAGGGDRRSARFSPGERL